MRVKNINVPKEINLSHKFYICLFRSIIRRALILEFSSKSEFISRSSLLNENLKQFQYGEIVLALFIKGFVVIHSY